MERFGRRIIQHRTQEAYLLRCSYGCCGYLSAISLAVMETLIISISLLVGRNFFGHIFSSDKETIEYVARMAPLVSIAIILDGLQGDLSGIARGCGWQHIGAYINLGAFYLWGIPIAACLAFWIHLKGVGLWIGIQTGAALQTLLLAFFTGFTNWENQAMKRGSEWLLPKVMQKSTCHMFLRFFTILVAVNLLYATLWQVVEPLIMYYCNSSA